MNKLEGPQYVYNYDVKRVEDYQAIIRSMPGSFHYVPSEGQNQKFYLGSGPKPYTNELKWYQNSEWQHKLIYRTVEKKNSEGKSIALVVQKVLENMGFLEWEQGVHDEDNWNLLWKNQRPSLGEYQRSAPYQKMMHIPKSGSICTKGNLAR